MALKKSIHNNHDNIVESQIESHIVLHTQHRNILIGTLPEATEVLMKQ